MTALTLDFTSPTKLGRSGRSKTHGPIMQPTVLIPYTCPNPDPRSLERFHDIDPKRYRLHFLSVPTRKRRSVAIPRSESGPWGFSGVEHNLQTESGRGLLEHEDAILL